MIHDAGGLAVWAHPFWDLDEPGRGRGRARRASRTLGLDGVEAFYITHTAEQTRIALDAAQRLGLLTTGSADFHGPEHPLFSALPGLRAARPGAGSRPRLAEPASGVRH